MARGDSIFGRTDVDWFTGEKTSHLRPTERDFYHNGLWLYAVKLRRETIPQHMADVNSIARRLSISRNSCVRHLSKLDTLGLITVHPDKSITVHGVRDMHQRITWRDDPIATPYGGRKGPAIEDELQLHIGEEEEESYSYSSIKPSSLLTPTPREPGKEDVHIRGRTGEPSPDPLDPGTIISDIEIIHSLASEITLDLNLPDEAMPELSEIISHFPATWIADARSATLDKIHAVSEGKQTEFTKGPLEYFAGILDRRRRES